MSILVNLQIILYDSRSLLSAAYAYPHQISSCITVFPFDVELPRYSRFSYNTLNISHRYLITPLCMYVASYLAIAIIGNICRTPRDVLC